MYITYKFMGFDDTDEDTLLEYTSEEERDYPPYFKIKEDEV